MLSNRLGVPYPVFLVLGGARVGPCSHRARDRATAGSGPSDLPPAAPLLGGLFLLPTRPQGKSETDSIPVYRPHTAYYHHRRPGGAPTGRPSAGGSVRSGGDRLADRPGGGDSHRRAPGSAAPDRYDPRG